jgi:cob(I)alamin adenosyltransferase
MKLTFSKNEIVTCFDLKNKNMKIYTKTGDKGQTSFYDGSRALKSTINFEVVGEVDELSSRVGLVCALIDKEYFSVQLRKIQATLQGINSHIATVDKTKYTLPTIEASLVTDLEIAIDAMEKVNPKLTKFILPGVTQTDAHAHLCRTQTRKVERMIIGLCSEQPNAVPEIVMQYINRLSDFFFVFARWLCSIKNIPEYFA